MREGNAGRRDCREDDRHLKTHDAVSYNIVIGALARAGRVEAALEIFKDMQSDPTVDPTAVTYQVLISSLEHDHIKDALSLVETMKENEIDPTARTNKILLELFAETGEVDAAIAYFEDVREITEGKSNAHLHNLMLRFLSQFGRLKENAMSGNDVAQDISVDTLLWQMKASGLNIHHPLTIMNMFEGLKAAIEREVTARKDMLALQGLQVAHEHGLELKTRHVRSLEINGSLTRNDELRALCEKFPGIDLANLRHFGRRNRSS